MVVRTRWSIGRPTVDLTRLAQGQAISETCLTGMPGKRACARRAKSHTYLFSVSRNKLPMMGIEYILVQVQLVVVAVVRLREMSGGGDTHALLGGLVMVLGGILRTASPIALPEYGS